MTNTKTNLRLIDWQNARRRVEEAKRMCDAALAAISRGDAPTTLQCLDLAREDLRAAVKRLAPKAINKEKLQ